MFIPYGKQNINQADVDAVVQVLQSDFLTQGPQVPLFEKSVAELVGAKYAFAMNSATSALHVACLALGLKGDVLWTSPITFVASANCALYCEADVDFVDIDPDTYNLSVDALKAKLEIAKQNNKLPKIVVPVHLCGQPCDMEKSMHFQKNMVLVLLKTHPMQLVVNIKKVILVLTSIPILQSLVFTQSKLLQRLKVEWRLPIMKI